MRTGFVILFSSVLFLNQEHRRQAPWATNQPESRDSRELQTRFSSRNVLLPWTTAFAVCTDGAGGGGALRPDSDSRSWF